MLCFAALSLTIVGVALIPHALGADSAKKAHNPIIWADVPDIAIMRVGKTYYMSSTTMHMCPGLPIMKSTDLVNWRMASYAYETLADNEAFRLENGKDAYGKGSWASSLRFHNGVFYVSTFSATSGRTHFYTTRDPERGPWKETSFEPAIGDHSLFFDDDGRAYLVYGNARIEISELNPDLTGIKPGGVHKVLVENVNAVFGTDQGGLNGEGSQLFKINGRYYLFNIASPGSRWARTVIVHRADTLTGPYEGRIVLDDRGIAQGGLIDTPEGKWYAYLFKDNGAVGRIPYLVPVTWKDGWPVLGENGKAPMTLDIPAGGQGVSGVSGIVASDEFNRKPGDPTLPLAWQWNHNPDNDATGRSRKRPGFLRLTPAGSLIHSARGQEYPHPAHLWATQFRHHQHRRERHERRRLRRHRRISETLWFCGRKDERRRAISRHGERRFRHSRGSRLRAPLRQNRSPQGRVRIRPRAGSRALLLQPRRPHLDPHRSSLGP